MRIREIALGLAVLSSIAPVAAAETLTERIQAGRMTILHVDQASGRFQCVEHKRWTAVSKADLKGVGTGDIVRVERNGASLPRLMMLRRAADELTSPEG